MSKQKQPKKSAARSKLFMIVSVVILLVLIAGRIAVELILTLLISIIVIGMIAWYYRRWGLGGIDLEKNGSAIVITFILILILYFGSMLVL